MGSKLTDLARIATADTGDLFYIVQTVGDTGASRAISRKSLDSQWAVQLSRATDTGKYLADSGFALSDTGQFLSDSGAFLSDSIITTLGRNLVNDTGQTMMRSTLGLGTAAVKNTGTSGDAVPLLDGANTWSAAQVFSASGNYLFGSTVSADISQEGGTAFTPPFQLHSVGTPSISQYRWANNNVGARAGFAKSRGATIGSHAVVQSDDSLGVFVWNGDDGTAFKTAVYIGAAVDGSPGSGDMPGRFIIATTPDSTAVPVIRLTINSTGFANLSSGSLGRAAPVTKTADFTVAANENWLINNKAAATCTVTLPAAASFPGREIMIKNVQAFTVVSASSNVVPLAGGAAGTAILSATAGRWVTLVSDGTNWIAMAGVI